MPAHTRSQFARTLLATPPSTAIRISSPSALERFVLRANAESHVGLAVEELEIGFANSVSFAGETLRRCLQLVPNVADVILDLPPRTPSNILQHVTFPHLQLFKTNLPHYTLLDFLEAHLSLKLLILGSCGSPGECAFASLSHVDHIVDLEGPSQCISHFMGTRLVRLTAHLSYDWYSKFATRSLPLSIHLVVLSMEILPDDFQVLNSISQTAPSLRKLKLMENGIPMRRGSSSRRVWNDFKGWAMSLRKLRLLEELIVVTPAKLVRHSGDVLEEKELLGRWLTGRRNHPGSPSDSYLYHVGLWYGSQDLGESVISNWYKVDVTWARSVHNGQPHPASLT